MVDEVWEVAQCAHGHAAPFVSLAAVRVACKYNVVTKGMAARGPANTMWCKLLNSGSEDVFGPQHTRRWGKNTSQIKILLASHFFKKGGAV